MKLIIGNKNYSSWSLRAWLLLSAFEVDFEEVKIYLNKQGTAEEIRKYNRAGKVPALEDEGLIVWDSLAICEYISETRLDNKGWPQDVEARALARSSCAEMHSGFLVLRERLPMNCRATGRSAEITPELAREIERIDSLWCSFRQRFMQHGDYLFGEFSIADCMFAPVVFRFMTYGVETSETSRAYIQTMMHHPKMQLWLEQAREEEEVILEEEVGR